MQLDPVLDQPGSGPAVEPRAAPAGGTVRVPAEILVLPLPATPARPAGGGQARGRAGHRPPARLHGRAASQRRELELAGRITAPIAWGAPVLVVGARGGCGRTTVAAVLAQVLAAVRGEPVGALDAMPVLGTLARRVPEAVPVALPDLPGPGGPVAPLEVLRASQELWPPGGSAVDEGTLADPRLERYALVVVDCPAGMPAPPVLDQAAQLTVVVRPTLDGGRSDLQALDWLDAWGYGALVRRAVAVLLTDPVSRRPRTPWSTGGPAGARVPRTPWPTGGPAGARVPQTPWSTDLAALHAHLQQRCAGVVRLPDDAALRAGAAVEVSRLRPRTKWAGMELAAAVVGGLADRPLADRRLEELVEEVQLAAGAARGYVGASVQRPTPSRPGWRVALGFGDRDQLAAWRSSGERERWQRQAQALGVQVLSVTTRAAPA